MKNKHIGSSFEDFLKAEGIHEAATSLAIKRVIAWQLAEAMKAKKISKAEMARRLKTSRTQVARFLDPENVSVQLSRAEDPQSAAARRGRNHCFSPVENRVVCNGLPVISPAVLPFRHPDIAGRLDQGKHHPAPGGAPGEGDGYTDRARQRQREARGVSVMDRPRVSRGMFRSGVQALRPNACPTVPPGSEVNDISVR